MRLGTVLPRRVHGPAALAGLLLAVMAAPAGAAVHVVRSGPLEARVQEDPWRLEFVTRDGPTLAEAEGTRLGFRTAAGWMRALRVGEARRDGEGLVVRAVTSDPAGRALVVRIEPAGDGVISLRASIEGETGAVEASGVGFRATAEERFLGLGQRATGVDHRGRDVESYVADGPYNREERPFLQGFVPPAGMRFRDDATYYPVPWVLSTRGYGVLADVNVTTYHRFATQDSGTWSLEATGGPEGSGFSGALGELALRIFAGPRPADVLRRYTDAVGRQPKVDAPWVWGPWFQPGGSREQVLAQMKKLQDADAPVSVAQTYNHYLPCGDHRANRDAERARVKALHDRGVAVTTYFNPMLCSNYQPAFDEAAAAGGLTRTAAGEPYVYRYSASTDDVFVVGQFDFTSAAGRDIFRRLLGEAIDDGHDGWMEDFGEYTPLDSRSSDGSDGRATHNAYPVQYHCTAFEHVRRLPRPVVRFQRSGWTGAAPCAQVVWGGDPSTDWGFDGLRSALYSGLGMGLSGIGRWGSDIGGFFALGTRSLSDELLDRWVQFGFVSGVMRTQRNGVALPPRGRPQVDDDAHIKLWRRYAKLRTQLYPYLVAADAAYRRSGMPMMRHLALAFPGDRRSVETDDQLMLGGDLMAAPVMAPDVRERELHLPPGEWVDLWRSAQYVESDGSLRLAAARVLSGPGKAKLPAPLEELPLLVRAGAVIPMLAPGVASLAGEVPTNRVFLLAFPRGRSSALAFEKDRLLSEERPWGWSLRVRGPRRRYSLQASLATLRRPFRPCGVTLGGRRVPRRRWSYDRAAKALRVDFTAATGTLRALRARRPAKAWRCRTRR